MALIELEVSGRYPAVLACSGLRGWDSCHFKYDDAAAGTADAAEEAGTNGAATLIMGMELPVEFSGCAAAGVAVTGALDTADTTEAAKSGDKTDEAEDGTEDALDFIDIAF
jgi:hypothetical protein